MIAHLFSIQSAYRRRGIPILMGIVLAGCSGAQSSADPSISGCVASQDAACAMDVASSLYEQNKDDAERENLGALIAQEKSLALANWLLSADPETFKGYSYLRPFAVSGGMSTGAALLHDYFDFHPDDLAGGRVLAETIAEAYDGSLSDMAITLAWYAGIQGEKEQARELLTYAVNFLEPPEFGGVHHRAVKAIQVAGFFTETDLLLRAVTNAGLQSDQEAQAVLNRGAALNRAAGDEIGGQSFANLAALKDDAVKAGLSIGRSYGGYVMVAEQEMQSIVNRRSDALRNAQLAFAQSLALMETDLHSEIENVIDLGEGGSMALISDQRDLLVAMSKWTSGDFEGAAERIRSLDQVPVPEDRKVGLGSGADSKWSRAVADFYVQADIAGDLIARIETVDNAEPTARQMRPLFFALHDAGTHDARDDLIARLSSRADQLEPTGKATEVAEIALWLAWLARNDG